MLFVVSVAHTPRCQCAQLYKLPARYNYDVVSTLVKRHYVYMCVCLSVCLSVCVCREKSLSKSIQVHASLNGLGIARRVRIFTSALLFFCDWLLLAFSSRQKCQSEPKVAFQLLLPFSLFDFYFACVGLYGLYFFFFFGCLVLFMCMYFYYFVCFLMHTASM